MQLRHGAEHADGPATESHHDRAAGRKHHGQQTAGEHLALRHVHVAGEPDGRRGHSGGVGCVDANALRAGDTRAVGAGLTDSFDRGHAGAQQHFEANVRVRRRHSNRGPGSGDRDGAVKSCAANGVIVTRDVTLTHVD